MIAYGWMVAPSFVDVVFEMLDDLASDFFNLFVDLVGDLFNLFDDWIDDTFHLVVI